MIRRLIEGFYDKVFSSSKEEEVPYANKVFMFIFSIATFTFIIFIAVKDILKNLDK
ncbi:hypothetical protein QQ008_00270 [Fulvivirgaceae bacterium BMA10]|uniref:Uncharacterized protein n=1 Tax=Splendidivirga corallicola TaxID=3051826 RepID=A0ABT8KGC4_9BACT|nr:hypothetical protein [Fulvivirgaceae bacterium BMA10]